MLAEGSFLGVVGKFLEGGTVHETEVLAHHEDWDVTLAEGMSPVGWKDTHVLVFIAEQHGVECRADVFGDGSFTEQLCRLFEALEMSLYEVEENKLGMGLVCGGA